MTPCFFLQAIPFDFEEKIFPLVCFTHIIPFVQTSDVLKRLLTENGDIEYTEWYFRFEERISNINILYVTINFLRMQVISNVSHRGLGSE